MSTAAIVKATFNLLILKIMQLIISIVVYISSFKLAFLQRVCWRETMPQLASNMQRNQFSAALTPYGALPQYAQPPQGWARSMREALGMTQVELANRMSASRQSIQEFERAEVTRRITLESLDRMATAMGCKVVLAIVPVAGTIDDMRLKQAHKRADALLRPVAHTMMLEAQGVSSMAQKRQRDALIDDLLRGNGRELWRE
jgi:predicted DNA-binding mobile mystery protein A